MSRFVWYATVSVVSISMLLVSFHAIALEYTHMDIYINPSGPSHAMRQASLDARFNPQETGGALATRLLSQHASYQRANSEANLINLQTQLIQLQIERELSERARQAAEYIMIIRAAKEERRNNKRVAREQQQRNKLQREYDASLARAKEIAAYRRVAAKHRLAEKARNRAKQDSSFVSLVNNFRQWLEMSGHDHSTVLRAVNKVNIYRKVDKMSDASAIARCMREFMKMSNSDIQSAIAIVRNM